MALHAMRFNMHRRSRRTWRGRLPVWIGLFKLGRRPIGFYFRWGWRAFGVYWGDR